MKRIALLLLPLILFLGFLTFKPPALATGNKPATDQVTSEVAPATPEPGSTKKSSTKPPVIQGGDDDDDDDDDEEDDDHDRKPSYGGHDDDDYDD
jgi:hypothetical protein